MTSLISFDSTLTLPVSTTTLLRCVTLMEALGSSKEIECSGLLFTEELKHLGYMYSFGMFTEIKKQNYAERVKQYTISCKHPTAY